jgi:hypothetical protein
VATDGGRSAALCEHAIDVQEHAPEIAIDLVVPIAQYFKPSRREMRISDSIFFLMFIKVMLPAVDLDDDASPQTYKIDDIAPAALVGGNEIPENATSADEPRV